MVCGTSASGFSRQVGYLFSVFRSPRSYILCVPAGGTAFVILFCLNVWETEAASHTFYIRNAFGRLCSYYFPS